ncbi:MAG: hypothetical protein HY653_03625 [Acidobacteria bacterium]|nr:hypothetical protein [Acidobacteriota bacterium]
MKKPTNPAKGAARGESPAESLIRMLATLNFEEGRRTVQALGETRDPAAIKALVSVAKQSGALRTAALAALRKLAAENEAVATELAIVMMEEKGEVVTGQETGVHEISPADRRRSPRVLLEIPVLVRWEDEKGEVFTETTTTKVVNAYGALVVLKNRVRVGMELQVTNLATRASAKAKVVCLGDLTPDRGLEVGIELESSDPEFWVGRNPRPTKTQPSDPAPAQRLQHPCR